VGTAGRRTFITVNGRAVRDTGIVRAAEAAYRSTIGAGLRPSVLLEVELPGGEVDVNVHPAKAEVRFRDRWTVERAVERAVRHALGTGESGATVGYVRTFLPVEAPLGVTLGVEALRQPFAPPTPMFGEVAAATEPTEVAEQLVVPPLTQFHRTYITFERHDALVLIDQHSAHERVLYERFMRDMEGGSAASQQLLFPLTLHLAPAEAEAFEEHRDVFARLGFAAEAFGGNSVVVHAVPVPHARFDAERCLRDTLAALTGDRAPGAHGKHERLAATVACKAAIKAGDLLATDEMRALYLALARTTLPAHDVHGRATILQLGWDELDRRFGRT
jgi:DNA mismatch repair protein MutL